MKTQFSQVRLGINRVYENPQGHPGKKNKELNICFSKVVPLLEMLRNWGEPATSALSFYQIIKDENFTFA